MKVSFQDEDLELIPLIDEDTEPFALDEALISEQLRCQCAASSEALQRFLDWG